MIAKEQISQGLRKLEEAVRACSEKEARFWHSSFELALGQVYLRIVDKSEPVSLSTMARNIGFIIKNVPAATKRAEDHFKKAIGVAKQIGAKSVLGQAYLGLGLLHKAKKRTDKAKELVSEAIQLFQQSEAELYLKQAKETLASME